MQFKLVIYTSTKVIYMIVSEDVNHGYKMCKFILPLSTAILFFYKLICTIQDKLV